MISMVEKLMSVDCKICGAAATKFLAVKVLKNKHSTNLHECTACGFIFMDPIYWLEEAYDSPITALDLGYVQRNLVSAKLLEELLSAFPERSCFVDYGGGTGLFVRLMRDKGFRFHIVEPYTETTFANNCDADVDRFGKYEALTAIEVFEHLPNPVESVAEMLSFSSVILFTTELYPSSRPDFSSWWYSGLEHGQHVSFHSENSLKALADKFDLQYIRISSTWHLIAPENHPLTKLGELRTQPKWRRRVLKLSKRLRSVFIKPKRRGSLIQKDYNVVKAAFLNGSVENVHLDQDLSEG